MLNHLLTYTTAVLDIVPSACMTPPAAMGVRDDRRESAPMSASEYTENSLSVIFFSLLNYFSDNKNNSSPKSITEGCENQQKMKWWRNVSFVFAPVLIALAASMVLVKSGIVEPRGAVYIVTGSLVCAVVNVVIIILSISKR